MWFRFRKAELSSVAIRVLFGLPYGMSTLQVLTIETITEVRGHAENVHNEARMVEGWL
jgi:hypothetical protein